MVQTRQRNPGVALEPPGTRGLFPNRCHIFRLFTAKLVRSVVHDKIDTFCPGVCKTIAEKNIKDTTAFTPTVVRTHTVKTKGATLLHLPG